MIVVHKCSNYWNIQTEKKKSEYLQKKINERETYILMTGIDYREILNMMNSAYEQSNPTKKRAFKWIKIKLPIDFGLKK